MPIYKFTIGEEDQGSSVKGYLKNRQYFSTALIKRARDTVGGITVRGREIRTVDKLGAGDALVITLPSEKSTVPPGEVEVPVVFEDGEVIVFNKPAGMATHPSAGHRGDTLANAYVAHLQKRGESGVFRPINRLDRNTSGLVVAGKTMYSAHFLQNHLEKTYRAVAFGKFAEKTGVIDLPIARKEGSIIEREVRPDGKGAKTHFTVEEEWGDYSLVKVELKTGRTHQIRVHFSHLGHPLMGDDLYGGDHELLNRQALVCSEVRFIHPIHRKLYIFRADLGQDIQKALQEHMKFVNFK